MLGFVPGHVVALLDLAGKLVTVPGHDIEVVDDQLAPLFLGLAADLLPVSCDSIPVRSNLLGRRSLVRRRTRQQVAIRPEPLSGSNSNLVLDRLHAVDAAGDLLGSGLLGGTLGEAG